jgi:MoxR-like ATPase
MQTLANPAAPANHPVKVAAEAVGDSAAQVRRLIEGVSHAFIGKEEVVTRAVLTLVAGGHVLLEDLPGLGKTLLAKSLSKSLSASFKRIQFTADLLPSDITGVTVYSSERHEFSFRPGPVFANVLLGDEINRATPRTQSSLLEAMEEHHVTVDGQVYPLPAPFFVVATQNPIELEGTYPLPFAQMDRFMTRLTIGYLEKDAEVQMLRAQQHNDPLEQVRPVMDCDMLTRLQAAVRQIKVNDSLRAYLVDIIRATRTAESLEYGASPRGSLDLQCYSQALALLAGRDYVLPDDIKQAARLVLPHRLICRKGTRSVSVNAHTVIDHIVDSVPVPV